MFACYRCGASPCKCRDRCMLIYGDALKVMPEMEAESIDAIVCDPPYGLKFMGKLWDYGVPGVEFWRQCLRVAKPGAHLLAFGGTRTFHRLACAVEDAGWEIRDTIAWIYGSGFPKSLDVSKAIDKAAIVKCGECDGVGSCETDNFGERVSCESCGGLGKVKGVEREKIGAGKCGGTGDKYHGPSCGRSKDFLKGEFDITAPATDAAKQWEGYGTALKPALEPITVARKPLIGTVAANVLEHGTGGLNIDGCRVGTESIEQGRSGRVSNMANGVTMNTFGGQGYEKPDAIGRWPANLIHDGSEQVLELFPETKSGVAGKNSRPLGYGGEQQIKKWEAHGTEGYADSGSAARFFYCAKASKSDRRRDNDHPTVKPIDLMQYLCRLVTPPGGTILDPFMGSGSTGYAAWAEGFRFIGIEIEEKYCYIAASRLGIPPARDGVKKKGLLF